MTFYGAPEEDKFRLTELSNEIVAIYKKNNRSAVQADNMLLALCKMSLWKKPNSVLPSGNIVLARTVMLSSTI
jgi:hypothetical protein